MNSTDTTETKPRKRGRKPSTKITETAPQLPLPPSKQLKPEKFWEYWRMVEGEFPDRTYCYVYRTWPVINRQQVNEEAANSIDKVNFIEISDFGKRWGNGDYHFMLTDPYLAVKGHKNVTNAFLSIREPDNPPVLDYGELVMNDPANTEYIQQLRARGTILPGDEEVMNKETTAVLAGTIKDLVENRGTAPAAEQAVTRGVVETITQAAKASNELMQETYAHATRVQFQQPDPVEALIKAATVFKTLMPQQSGNTELFPVLLQILKDNQASSMAQFQAQLESMKASNQLLRDMLVNRPAAEPPAPTTASRLQERLEEKMLEDILSGSGQKGGSGTDWLKVMQYALPAVTTIVGGLVAAFAPKAAPASGPQPHPTIQANPATPQPAPTPQAQEEDMYQNLLTAVAGPLLKHLNDELTGADFADFVIQGYGRTVYDLVKQQGAELVLAQIARHPQLGHYAAQLPERFKAFVDEFCRRDEIRKAEAEEEDQ